MKSLLRARCEVLMSQPMVGRAGLELMFGSWCRGRLTMISTLGGQGTDVTVQERLGGGPLAEGIGMLDAVYPGLRKVGKQSACMAESKSILWPGKVALHR